MHRKLMTLGLLWIGLGLAVAGPLAAEEAEPPSPQSFLLRYHYRFAHENGFDEKEVLVFRDGLAIVRAAGNFEGHRYNLLVRAQTLPESFARFTAALAEHRIGQQVGNCNSDWVPWPEESYTWFGRGKRQNTIVAGMRFSEPCPREVDDLIYEIVNFILNVPLDELVRLKP